jgi:hypothetical protein
MTFDRLLESGIRTHSRSNRTIRAALSASVAEGGNTIVSEWVNEMVLFVVADMVEPGVLDTGYLEEAIEIWYDPVVRAAF